MRSRAVIVGAVLAAALVSGGWLMQAGLDGRAATIASAKLFDDVLTRVQQFYIDSLSSDKLYQKAVDGMLRELHDPHSVYLSPERLAKLNESTSGRYAGVGIQIDVRDGWITVVTPLPGTPAERAGIASGDRVVEIEGHSTRGWTSDEALKALRGSPGSTVRTLVERPGVGPRMAFTLTRQEIRFHPVQHALMLRDGIGYVDLTVFSEDANDELRVAIDSLRGVGMRGLIFDLRGDPGGLLDQGVAVADLFLDPPAKIVSMSGRNQDSRRDFIDRFPQLWPQLPIVVLVDSGSASASEIVAGALQDHDRALVVGTTTYGKGSAQSLFRMPEGGALKLTTALWYTPSGRSINRKHTDPRDADDGADALTTLGDKPARPQFHTDAGRTVYGGGGIAPDVLVSDSALSVAEDRLQNALGKQTAHFRDALTAYALSLKARGTVRSPAFTITPQMRNELFDMLRQRNVGLPRGAYDSATPLVDRLLSYQIARYVFGAQAEFERTTHDDPMVNTAIVLLRAANTPEELLKEGTPQTRANDGAK